MSSNLQNSIWPNTNGNLGKIKVQIPAGTVDDPWPEGDALVGNFVYNSGKLVGFIDTAALIPNESGETTIPYDTIDTKFPGILKDTFIINAGERCKYQFAKLEEDIAVYTSTRLFEIMDADKFKVSYDKDENKVTVAVPLDTTAAQIAEVKSLLNRVLPSSLVTEIDPLPLEYTRLEYLEREAGTPPKITLPCEFDFREGGMESFAIETCHAFTTFEPQDQAEGICKATGPGRTYSWGKWNYEEDTKAKIFCVAGANFDTEPDTIVMHDVFYNVQLVWQNLTTTLTVDDVSGSRNVGNFDLYGTEVGVFYERQAPDGYSGQDNIYGKKKYFRIRKNGELVYNLLPALDPTGAPCMFDTVTRKAFYNGGTGDFTYPGKETEATTYSLRNRIYAQYTEHGIRRLYRVPKGYNGSKEDYAAENGFKLIVEPPMPEEGYWTPVWHDRENCIELEWVETEPPAEETSPTSPA